MQQAFENIINVVVPSFLSAITFLSHLGTFTTQTDIWSFAVTVWEIFTFAAEQPFESLSDQQVIENALSLAEAPGKSSQYLSQPKGCPDGTFFMLRKCWKTVPEERPSFQELFGFFTALCPEFKDERV